MKFIKLLPCIAAALVMISCDNEPTEKGKFADLSEPAQNYFKMNQSNNNTENSFGFRNAGPMNMSFQHLFNAAVSSGRLAEDTTETEPSDTTIYTEPEPWISCAKITNVTNEDGSVTYTYDYGDGCEEGNDFYKLWSFGKYSYTYSNNVTQQGGVYKDVYFYSSVTDNFGQRWIFEGDTSNWLSNGHSNYEGESLYDIDKNTFSGDFSGAYQYDYTWNAQHYSCEGVSKYTYTTDQYTVEKNSFTSTYDGNYYKGDVLEPLVYRYSCSDANSDVYIWTYTSGREFVRYKEGDKEGSFEVYYGDGECDNIIVIIENGNRVEIDLGKNAFILQ